MGREVKRVPLKFDWPLNKTWKGYLNPHYDGHCENCTDCNGCGSTTALQRLEDLVSLLLLSAEDAMKRKSTPHPYFASAPLYNTANMVVSPDILELTANLAGRPCRAPFGHDSCDRWAATKAIIKAAGLKKSWGTCQRCKGEGSVWDSRESEVKAARWRRKEPPKGVAYQMWETVSEGSPISPPFKTPEELADWLCEHPRGADVNTTREQWLNFIRGPGWAPSMISTPEHGLMSGVEAASVLKQ